MTQMQSTTRIEISNFIHPKSAFYILMCGTLHKKKLSILQMPTKEVSDHNLFTLTLIYTKEEVNLTNNFSPVCPLQEL